MQAKFLLQREKNNTIVYGKQTSPNFFVHFHSHIEIYVVTDGEMEVIINNQKHILRKGEISVALSYDTHGYRTPEAAKAIYIIIPTAYCGEFLPVLSSKHASSPFINDPKTYNTVLNALETMVAGVNDISKQGYVYVILGAILDNLSAEEQQKNQESIFSPEILIYINDHFREELTLSMLATEFGYNPSYLSRTFHQTFGISFGKYLTMMRLREFILLMRSNDKSITEAAFECGFGSMRSFYRAFGDEFECTPKEYFKAERKKSNASYK